MVLHNIQIILNSDDDEEPGGGYSSEGIDESVLLLERKVISLMDNNNGLEESSKEIKENDSSIYDFSYYRNLKDILDSNNFYSLESPNNDIIDISTLFDSYKIHNIHDISQNITDLSELEDPFENDIETLAEENDGKVIMLFGPENIYDKWRNKLIFIPWPKFSFFHYQQREYSSQKKEDLENYYYTS